MKNLLNSISTKTFCVVCFMMIISGFLYGQPKKINFPGNKTIKKAEKSDFIVHDQGDMLVMYNKHNSIMIYESNYEQKLGYLDLDYVVKFYDRQKIDSLVYKNIAPYYQRFNPKYSDDTSSFDIALYAGADGKVCEISFALDRNSDVPLKVIEKLEDDILALGLKLEFDPNSYYTQDALWVYYPVMYSVLTMKKKIKIKAK